MYYDLEDRTKNFSKKIIRVLKKIKINEINRNINITTNSISN